jgi:hypothetical protein
MGYPGSKNAQGVWQRIINLIPPHRVYIEACVGGGAILKAKRPAEISFAIDVDPGAIGRLAGEVLPRGTQLVVADVLDWLRSYPFTGAEFVYLDPPYLRSTRRSQRRIYRHEFTRKQHGQLLTIAKRLGCPVMISGYPSLLYRGRLAKWHREEFQVATHHGPATECLWMNYPRPLRLHDYRFLGESRRERQDLRRKRARWSRRFASLDPLQQQAILQDLVGISAGGADLVGTVEMPAGPASTAEIPAAAVDGGNAGGIT